MYMYLYMFIVCMFKNAQYIFLRLQNKCSIQIHVHNMLTSPTLSDTLMEAT